ncbi:MAG: hypothetical protein CMJ31_04305 [Phycisphaerae bacterium]|nr:hypothetical protein [Phycisphaerae bacterium]
MAGSKLARMRQAMFDWTASLRAGPTPATDEPSGSIEIEYVAPTQGPADAGEATVVGAATANISREDMIERLLELNPSVTLEFLEQFPDERLEHYLARLTTARRPRGPEAIWVRRPESSAIVSHVRVR